MRGDTEYRKQDAKDKEPAALTSDKRKGNPVNWVERGDDEYGECHAERNDPAKSERRTSRRCRVHLGDEECTDAEANASTSQGCSEDRWNEGLSVDRPDDWLQGKC